MKIFLSRLILLVARILLIGLLFRRYSCLGGADPRGVRMRADQRKILFERRPGIITRILKIAPGIIN